MIYKFVMFTKTTTSLESLNKEAKIVKRLFAASELIQ